MLRNPSGTGPAARLALVLLIAVAAGCSSSSDSTGPAPSPNGNYVSGNGAVQIGAETATMMINIGGLSTTTVATQATGRLHIGVNDFVTLSGQYLPESNQQVTLTQGGGVAVGGPYVFNGQLEGSTITGSLSGGNVSGTVQVSLATTSVPTEAVILLGPWDFEHEVTIGTLAAGVDPCPVPVKFRTITDSCSDRYQVEIEGNMLLADSCNDSCLPDVDLATGTLDGTTVTLHLPEVGEPTTPANRLFSMNLPGCNVIWTGQVALNVTTGSASLVNLVSECQGSGDSCDDFCTNGQLNSACHVNYELELTRCEGGCECLM